MSKSQATVWFWSAVLTVASLWILLPFLLHTGYKTDVVEMQFHAKEWVIATHKHPMLPVWVLEIINILTGRAFVAPFIAAALCTVVTFFAVWRLARQVLSERLALIGTFSMLPFWSITIDSISYNHNAVLMACWTFTIWIFHNAFQTNKKRWWIAAGLTLGLGLYAKYTILLLAVAVLLYSLWNPRLRQYWKEIGPWLTVSISFVIFLPLLCWFYQEGFGESTSYATRYVHMPGLSGIIAYLFYPVRWIVCILGLLLIAPLLLLIPSLGWKWKIRTPQSDLEKETRQYLLCCIAFPFLVFSLIPLFGVKGYAVHTNTLWYFLGVYLLLRFQRQDSADVFRRTYCWTSLAIFAMVIISVIQAVGSPYLMGTARGFHFPMQELGVKCDEIWYSQFNTPCPYITGSWRYAGNAAYAMKDRPSVHFYYDGIDDLNTQPTGTWSTDEDVNQKGGIILWEATEQTPDWVHRRFPNAEVLSEILELPYKTGAKIPLLRIGIAIVPPP